MGKRFISRLRVILIPIAACGACCLLAFLLATNHGAYDYNPHWSPTGQAIVFTCYPPTLDLNLDLTELIEPRRYYGDLPYSPIYSEVCTMAPNGTRRRRLTDNRVEEADPVWSTDGKQIAFVSRREDGQFLYLMNGDGTDQRRISPTRGAEHPAWSPDGQRIAFSSDNIRILDLASGVERAMNHTPADYPEWSPHGDAVAFIEGRWLDNSCRTHIVRADTGDEMVPPFASACQRVAWDPQGSRLAFVGADLEPMQGRLLYVFDLHAHRILPLTTLPTS